MANPRSGRGKSKATDQPEEGAVSDTATEPEAPNAEAPAAEAPKEEKAPVDHEGNLYAAIVTFAGEDPRNVEALQSAYREVPAAARGKVQGVAMKRAMTEGGVDMEVLGEVLDAFNNLPTAKSTSRTKPAVDEPTANALRLAGLMVAFQAVQESMGEGGAAAHAQAAAWFADGVPSEHEQAVLKIAGNVVTASAKSRGGGGTRQSFTDTLKDLIERGDLPVGAVLKGANDVTATVNADGSVTTLDQTFENLSKAARAHRTKDGKETSTNGWDFWQYEGKSVGSLRKA